MKKRRDNLSPILIGAILALVGSGINMTACRGRIGVDPPPMNWRPLPDGLADSQGLYDESNALVLTLKPQWTRDGNRHQFWVWAIPGHPDRWDRYEGKPNPVLGYTYGAHPDKETARQQGVNAVLARAGKWQ